MQCNASPVVEAVAASSVLSMITSNARAASYLVDVLVRDGYFVDETRTGRLSSREEASRLVNTVAIKYCQVNGLVNLRMASGRRQFAALALWSMMYRDDDPDMELTDVEEVLMRLGIVEYNVETAVVDGAVHREKCDPSLPCLTVSPALLLVLLHLLEFSFDLAFDNWRGIESVTGLLAALAAALTAVPRTIVIQKPPPTDPFRVVFEPSFRVSTPRLVAWDAPAPPTNAGANHRTTIRLATETAEAPVAYLNGPRAPSFDACAPWLVSQCKQAASNTTIDMDEELTKAGLSKSSTFENKVINARNLLDGLIRRWKRRGLPATEVPRRLYPLSHFLTGQSATAETEAYTLLQDGHGASYLAQVPPQVRRFRAPAVATGSSTVPGRSCQSGAPRDERGDGTAVVCRIQSPTAPASRSSSPPRGLAEGKLQVLSIRSEPLHLATTARRLVFTFVFDGQFVLKCGPGTKLAVDRGERRTVAVARWVKASSKWVASTDSGAVLSDWLASFLREDLHGIPEVEVNVIHVHGNMPDPTSAKRSRNLVASSEPLTRPPFPACFAAVALAFHRSVPWFLGADHPYEPFVADVVQHPADESKIGSLVRELDVETCFHHPERVFDALIRRCSDGTGITQGRCRVDHTCPNAACESDGKAFLILSHEEEFGSIELRDCDETVKAALGSTHGSITAREETIRCAKCQVKVHARRFVQVIAWPTVLRVWRNDEGPCVPDETLTGDVPYRLAAAVVRTPSRYEEVLPLPKASSDSDASASLTDDVRATVARTWRVLVYVREDVTAGTTSGSRPPASEPSAGNHPQRGTRREETNEVSQASRIAPPSNVVIQCLLAARSHAGFVGVDAVETFMQTAASLPPGDVAELLIRSHFSLFFQGMVQTDKECRSCSASCRLAHIPIFGVDADDVGRLEDLTSVEPSGLVRGDAKCAGCNGEVALPRACFVTSWPSVVRVNRTLASVDAPCPAEIQLRSERFELVSAVAFVNGNFTAHVKAKVSSTEWQSIGATLATTWISLFFAIRPPEPTH